MNGDLLSRLLGAHSDEEREWIVLQFNLESLEPALREAVQASAVPHWFDADFFAALLDRPAEETRSLFDDLIALSFVEPFPGRGHNVHERTRALLLDRLWQADRERYRELSRRAVVYCETRDRSDPTWRIEAIYHLLIAQPDAGADQMQTTGWEWHNLPNFFYDRVEAMARAAREHADAGRLTDRSLGWTLFWEALLDYDYSRFQTAKRKFLKISVEPERDPYLTADRAFRLGDVHRMLDEYEAARERYEAALPLYRQIGSQLGEANCLFGLADLDRQTERWSAAEEKYRQALAYYRSTGMRFNIALALQRLGYVGKGTGDLDKARRYFEEALKLFTEIHSPMAKNAQADLDELSL